MYIRTIYVYIYDIRTIYVQYTYIYISKSVRLPRENFTFSDWRGEEERQRRSLRWFSAEAEEGGGGGGRRSNRGEKKRGRHGVLLFSGRGKKEASMGSPGFSRYFSTVHGSRSLVFPTTSGRAYYRRPKGMVSLVHGRVLGGSPLSLKGQLPHSRELLLSILVPLQHRPTLFEARAKGDDRERERRGDTLHPWGGVPATPLLGSLGSIPAIRTEVQATLSLPALPACLPAYPPACQNLPSKSLWRIRTASSQIRQHPETLSKSSATITPPIVPRVTLRGRRYRRIHDRSYRDRRFRAVRRGRKEIEGAWWLLCSAVEEQVRAFAVRRRVEIFWRSAWNFHARIGKSYND